MRTLRQILKRCRLSSFKTAAVISKFSVAAIIFSLFSLAQGQVRLTDYHLPRPFCVTQSKECYENDVQPNAGRFGADT